MQKILGFSSIICVFLSLKRWYNPIWYGTLCIICILCFDTKQRADWMTIKDSIRPQFLHLLPGNIFKSFFYKKSCSEGCKIPVKSETDCYILFLNLYNVRPKYQWSETNIVNMVSKKYPYVLIVSNIFPQIINLSVIYSF